MGRSTRWAALWMATLCAPLISVAQAKKSVPAAPTAAPTDPNQSGELLEVERVKEKYWAQGQDSKMGVVQNRLFSKEGKFALGLLGGTSMADPFLSIKNYGITAGFHFSEFIGVSFVGWKNSVGKSSALKTAEDQGKEQNTVNSEWFMGAEALGSIMYGKLSLLGARIIYYDMHLSLGGGLTRTENDSAAVSGVWGVGQRFYITQTMSFRLDYRNQIYRETIREKVITAELGDRIGNRTVFAHTINAAVDFMF